MTDATRRPILSWLKSRPYHLAPWIVLLAMAPFAFPRRTAPTEKTIVDPPGLSESRVMPPMAFDAAEPLRGRAAARPAHIPWRGWRDIAWRTAREISVDRLPAVAGGVTFYTLLALIPAIGAFVALYGLFADVGAVEQQLRGMVGVFPPSVIQIVGEQMARLAQQKDGELGLAFVASLLLSVWSANASMRALFDGLNIAYDEEEKRPFAPRLLLTYAFTLCALVYAVAVAGVLIAAPLFLEAARLSALEGLLAPVRWLIVLVMTAVAFTVLYRFAPSRTPARWRWVWIGAAFAAAVWLVGSLGFSLYVNRIAHFDATYGPLGAVIAFMIWVWFSIMAILVGAELNAEIEHQTAVDSTTGPEQPIGARGATMADTVGLAFDPWEVLKREAGTVRRVTGGTWKRMRGR
ncbi:MULTISPECIES: YihY/virulence factor BrkB family protein [unclassified Caulobacter]|jgi:membrane protein|uniref:YihY/virulence factor BrkB family protein n=1 Tax=unclassified Caulobacter TaxID=2648921 RepID=UPI000C15971D|nr:MULTISPECIES: YihY/virulence factor BrkB family protein [unclassified Caulobacter]AZS22499.1 YihY/virulence factor BrkB family protein [Caulobacter sp. FWC26]